MTDRGARATRVHGVGILLVLVPAARGRDHLHACDLGDRALVASQVDRDDRDGRALAILEVEIARLEIDAGGGGLADALADDPAGQAIGEGARREISGAAFTTARAPAA